MPEKAAFFHFYLTFVLISCEISGLEAVQCEMPPVSSKHNGITDAQKLARFTCGDARVGGHAVEMIEALERRPGGKCSAALLGEALLKTGKLGAGVRIARRDGTACAGIAALEMRVAHAKAHEILLVRCEKLIFPKRRDAIHFQRGAKTQTH